MIATISPASYNLDETMSTLMYANRAKKIRNRPIVNTDPKDIMLKDYQDKIGQLKQELTLQARLVEMNTSKTMGVENLHKRIQEEKANLMANKMNIINEKSKISGQLTEHLTMVEGVNRQRAQLQQELASLESKLIVGGVPIEEEVIRQQSLLNDAETKLQSEKQKSNALKSRLALNKQDHSHIASAFSTAQSELDSLSRKELVLQRKIVQVGFEIEKVMDGNRDKKENLLSQVRELRKGLMLQEAIISHFIPPQEKHRMESKLNFDQSKNRWYLAKSQATNKIHRITSNPLVQQPLCHYAKSIIQNGTNSDRYRHDNIYDLEV